MTEPARDELLQRYREASAQDTARPGAHVQDRVRAHAEMMIASNRQATAEKMTAPPAANQSSWKFSGLAGIAVLGLSGLLFLQFERGSPEEKDAAFGQSRQDAVAIKPVEPAEKTKAPTASEVAPNSKRLAETAAPVAPAAEAALPTLRDSPPAKAPNNLPAKDEPLAAAADAMAGAPSVAAEAAPEARAMSPRALQKSQSAPVAATGSVRADAGSKAISENPLLDAARSGRTRELARMLQQGAPMNSMDAAGRTPLMLAAMQGHADAVRQLLDAGASTTVTDRDGLDAAQLARRQGFEAIARLIENRR
jgi:hypothetical protein